MSTQTFDTIMGGAWLACVATLTFIQIVLPTYRYFRAWSYVRFFIRYEMKGAWVQPKAWEGLK